MFIAYISASGRRIGPTTRIEVANIIKETPKTFTVGRAYRATRIIKSENYFRLFDSEADAKKFAVIASRGSGLSAYLVSAQTTHQKKLSAGENMAKQFEA